MSGATFFLRRAAAGAALAAAAAGCSAPESSPSSSRAGAAARRPPARRGLLAAAVGCYRLAPGPEVPAADRRAFPALVRLDSVPVAAGYPQYRRLGVLAPAGTPADWQTVWTADSLSDSVFLWVGDSFAGVSLGLAPAAAAGGGAEWDSLAGSAVNVGDLGPTERGLGRAAAVRVPCPREGGRRAPAA